VESGAEADVAGQVDGALAMLTDWGVSTRQEAGRIESTGSVPRTRRVEKLSVSHRERHGDAANHSRSRPSTSKEKAAPASVAQMLVTCRKSAAFGQIDPHEEIRRSSVSERPKENGVSDADGPRTGTVVRVTDLWNNVPVRKSQVRFTSV